MGLVRYRWNPNSSTLNTIINDALGCCSSSWRHRYEACSPPSPRSLGSHGWNPKFWPRLERTPMTFSILPPRDDALEAFIVSRVHGLRASVDVGATTLENRQRFVDSGWFVGRTTDSNTPLVAVTTPLALELVLIIVLFNFTVTSPINNPTNWVRRFGCTCAK